MVDNDRDNEPELIETIFYELDNGMFTVALLAGAAVAAFLVYIYMARGKNVSAVSAITNPAQFLVTPDNTPEDDNDEEDEQQPESVSIPADFTYAQAFQAERGMRG